MSGQVRFAENRANLVRLPAMAFGVGGGLYCALKSGSWSWFSWHPLCMMLALFPCVINAVMVKKIGGLENTRVHGTLMTLASGLMLFGFYVIHSNKELMGKEHYTTYHGKLGVFLVICFFSGGIVGFATLSPDYGKMKTDKNVRLFHKYWNRLLILLGWLACVSGFTTVYPDPLQGALFLVPIIFFSYYSVFG
mmetsp:Transcript_16076/g.26245  ORF Transcript_16076/g.26245 Transcript_16076/m.26245 type:complete len:193 (+) Transcript_16076:138-716(+)|eukprot:CAMPEP_0203773456 /NCGR_PEP_ID=MMETSP0099_2-20121227/4668_1 /ASSEMBLY_ACC=CAM_ASM_000209 /TAXON_ID=96639 /ORGANISM=" , Strain NY0313808BC1" /LENGTH=192 /DNA_ID=CAMNT_0050671289 /DNA_START=52 /DNA_END=630 /DNA_ORIENTATION=-